MFFLYLVENGLTVAGALVLYPFIGVRGLAVSWIGCYTLALPLAWRKLRQSTPITVSAGWLSRLLLCTGVMAAIVSLLLRAIPVPHALLGEIGRLVAISGLGGAALWAASIVFGVEELSELAARLRSLAR
jgi:peptidoglycan biosynthesis protein MviN/MurJ (putative lipid II flippase)